MNQRLRAFLAGAAGMALAFGVAELVHGLYQPVPSVPVAVAQRVIVLTPGDATGLAIGTLGKAATPVLIAVIVTLTLLLAGLFAVLTLRSGLLGLLGVSALAAVALLAALSQPTIALLATIATVMGSLAAGAVVSALLLAPAPTADGPPGPAEGGDAREPRTPAGRRREAHSEEGMAVGRGSFLALAGGVAVAGAAAAGAGRLLAGGGDGTAGGPGGPLEPTTGEGTGQQAAQGPPSPPPGSVSVDADGVPPWVTPNKNFYIIDTAAFSPQVDRDSWRLSIRGAVDNPVEIGYDELVSMPNREAYITMACVSNPVGGGLVSNALWTGVPLRAVLEEAGVSRDKIRDASEQLVGRSVDGWTSGFRTDLAFDGREALVAFGMNGSELPQKHGYPVRLVVPGLYGYVSATKWLSEIELTGWDFDAYWIKRGWSKTGPIKTQSRIDTVKDGDNVRAGTVPIGGVAWAPTRGISRVEVSTDGGETWEDARLARQLDEDAWRQWVYDWDAGSVSGERTIQVRATDGGGETQTDQEAEPIPSGATGYHTVSVTVG